MATLEVNGCSRLTPVEQEVILAALEEYTNALAIYQGTLRKPRRRSSDISIDCIFPEFDGLETSGMQLSSDAAAGLQAIKEEAERAKLYEDCLYMRRIVEELKEEIRQRGSYEILTREIEKIATRQREEEALLEEREKLEKLVTELRKTISDEKIANEGEKKRLVYELSEKQKRKEKLKLIADVELKYVAAWEKARCEQNSLRCDMEIKNLEKILSEYRAREKNEKRVHEGLTRFFTQETAFFEEKIKEWRERYVREKEMYEKEIRKVRIEIETRRKELDELEEEYRGNQEFIDMYLAEKEALRKQKEKEEHMRRSAIRIQAWWRGVMVRRKLGPYRPEEKKKKRQTKTKK